METLRPDDRPDDFKEFYDRIGAAQLEELYIQEWWSAVSRHHLALGLILPSAKTGGRLLDVGCASGYYSV